MTNPIRHPRQRHRLLQWRARLSIPALLAGFDERRVVAVVTAVNGGLAILSLVVLAWLIELPLLFPALGPSAFILFRTPFAPEAAPRSVIFGHLVGISVGYATWRATSFSFAQVISLDTGGLPILLSASLSMVLCSVLLIYLSCPHPPSCASALIVAMGAANTWLALIGMVVGVFLLTIQAFAISRMVGLRVPVWSHCEETSELT